ncbi:MULTISPECIES: site-specific integrase [pseudomallei group]|uniref:site-specific integrase n=1 Tax=pseudomallei group TaxID=111527 RepID=UPI00016AE55D|nr:MULTISPECIES: site-specific integrase [pseudomallei group]ARK65669.1 integrase [Burkholderia pseudomallei]ARK80459.1 integrase [Burkholderia pseudomallei]ARK89404.1 integrase [Burkholderia pseudomallei]ARL17163.1 integrase [Burkholderia pseudomallei]ARL22432.1 integrase [Burkholderia pseudomallei]
MASIIQIGSRWRAQVRRLGSKSISKTFRTKGAAEAWARDIESSIDKGREAAVEETITVGELVRRYREARKESGRPIGEKSNEHYMLARLESHFDDEVAAKLSTQRLVKFAQLRKKEGAGQYTIDMDISKLGTVFKHMASLLDLRLPHAPSIARPTLDHLRLIGPGNHRNRRPTRDEIVKIFEWFAEHPEREQAVPDVIRVAMKSAFRRGELFRLTWSDLDVERRLALVRDRKHPRQKKGNDEWVPLIGDSLEVLLRQPRYPVPPEYEAKRKADPAIEPHPNEFIFRFDKSTASKYFKRACVDKGIDDLRLHDLRHEATSALFEDGWDIPEVAAVTGHKDWRNLKRYTNLRPDQVAKKGQLTVMNRD